MCKIAYVAAVYNKINKKFQRLKIHTEMYSTNLIFDIVLKQDALEMIFLHKLL